MLNQRCLIISEEDCLHRNTQHVIIWTTCIPALLTRFIVLQTRLGHDTETPRRLCRTKLARNPMDSKLADPSNIEKGNQHRGNYLDLPSSKYGRYKSSKHYVHACRVGAAYGEWVFPGRHEGESRDGQLSCALPITP